MTDTITAGGALLARLKAVGVDYIFANSGTDFPPIIEGLAEAAARDIALPHAIVIPHEHAAMGMAHGYYLGTGRPQAVMAHTNVGLANCAIGAINAATEHVPVLLFSGRTPTVEQGRFGARTVPIGWGQEMRDQAALVREAVKWDYELRFPEQVAGNRRPRLRHRRLHPARPGLCQPAARGAVPALPGRRAGRRAGHAAGRRGPAGGGAGPGGGAAGRGGAAADRRPARRRRRGRFRRPGRAGTGVGDPGVPVLGGPARHRHRPCRCMSAPTPPPGWPRRTWCWSSTRWPPGRRRSHAPPPGCTVIQAGPDPLYARFPVRNFRSDLALAGETAGVILGLRTALQPLLAGRGDAVRARRDRIEPTARATRARVLAAAASGGTGERMSKAWVSRCLSDAVAGRKVSILSELGCPLEPMTLEAADSWFQEPHSGGLGWSFPAALGLQLSQPGRLVVATMGDGSYMFANPVACHQIAEAMALPILVLVLNNREWGAVRQSVVGLYPAGHAARANTMPLTSLEPSPDFTMVARASRAWTASVAAPGELPAVLAAAIEHVARHGTQALVEIAVAP